MGSERSLAGGTVAGVTLASETLTTAGSTVIHGGFVESIGTFEGADSTDHDVGALIVAGTRVKDFAGGAAGTSCVGSETGLAVVGTILASVVDGICSNGADLGAFEVEEVSAAAKAGGTFAWVLSAGLAG